MVEYDMTISIIILFLNALTVLVFIFNIIFDINKAIESKTRAYLDFYFKLVMISLIGALMSGVSFCLGIKMWLKIDYLILNSSHITNLRLIFAVLMAVLSGIVLLIDKKDNPFRIK